MLFFLVGSVSAVEISNVSDTEDSNLITDDVSESSIQNKLEISNEDSISETNIVNSHDDNLSDYPDDGVLKSADYSDYEDNNREILSAQDVENDQDVLSVSNDDVLSASTVASKLNIVDTHYSKSAAVFKVTLLDANSKAISNQKVSLKVNGKTYTGTTDSKGIASVKTTALAVGSYTVSLSYAGSSKYASSSLSKKVNVLSSLSGKDMSKYYGYVSTYNVTFWKDYNALANTKVSFTINGKSYVKTTNANGVASININLAPGKYVVTTTNPYSGEKLSNNINVGKDFVTLKHGTRYTYVLPNTKYTFKVTLKTAHNVFIKNAPVIFKFNNKKFTVKTNSKGVASLSIPKMSKGTYTISYRYYETNLFSGQAGDGFIYVKASTTKLKSSTLKMTYKDGSKFSVKVTNSKNKVLANKNVKFTLNGKTSTVKINSKGIAYLSVGNIKPGTYTVKYQYSTVGSSNYNVGTNKIVVAKQTATISAGDLVMNLNDGSVYKATVKDKSGNPLKNVKVKFTINGKTYTATTDSNGVAKKKIGLAVGYYSVKSVLSNSYYKTGTASKHITVQGTKFVASDKYVSVGSKVSFSVKLVNAKNKVIKNAKVTFKVNGKTYSATSNSKGIASVSVGKLDGGNYKIKYSQSSYSGSSTIHVVDKVTISQIVSASKTVKKYIVKYHKLPKSVKIGKLSYSTADYLYLASKAIVNLKSGNKDSIAIKDVSNPTKAGSAANKGNLQNYYAVAKSVVSYINSKGKAPNSISSDVGTIGYKGIVYAFSRVVDFYGSNHRLPSYVAINSLSTTSSTGSSDLNSINTIEDLAKYLAASTNCQVNNAKIKALVTKLTKGLTSDKAKANAIFEYVRDTVSYSFYYNTKHGAVGTLNAKSGNCVDHSHLLVAMYRNAGLAARYVHGTCTFSSGGVYGHVWTQVLIGNTWTVSDATSSRNSLGKVANWNAKSYSLKGYYSSLSF